MADEEPRLDHPIFVATEEERTKQAARRPRHWTDTVAESLLWLVVLIYVTLVVLWYLNRYVVRE